MVDGPNRSLLSGPYATHEEAKSDVEKVKVVAESIDQWSAFYAFGTASCDSNRPGLLNRTGQHVIGD